MNTILPIPNVGQRVRFVRSDWGDAGMNMPVGAEGKVIEASEERITLEIDEQWREGATDDGCWAFYPECGPVPHTNGFDMTPIEQFHFLCDYIS